MEEQSPYKTNKPIGAGINPIELRIGNLFKHTNRNGEFILRVEEISNKFVGTTYNGGIWKIKYDEIEPIPLTEEILMKAGFGKDHFNSNCFSIDYSNQGTLVVFSNKTPVAIDNELKEPFYCILNRLIHPIKWLHQLQNLYFTLTGQELDLSVISWFQWTDVQHLVDKFEKKYGENEK